MTSPTRTSKSLLFAVAIASSPCSTAFAPTRTTPLISKPATLPLNNITPLDHNNNNNNHALVSLGRIQTESSTSLQMGIRTFLKKKILRRSSGDDPNGTITDTSSNEEEAKEEEVANDVNLHALMSSPESAGLMEGSPNKYSEESNTTKKKDRKKAREERKNIQDSANEPAYSQEDIKERIRRVKGGGMTEEEKMMFLNTALTRTNERPKPRGPPIRQAIPGMDGEDGGSSNSAVSQKSADRRLWDAITKKGAGEDNDGPMEEISVASLLSDGKLKNEQAKRQYIESITNPDRFSSFSAMKTPSPAPAEPVVDYYEEDVEVDEVATVEEEVDADDQELFTEDHIEEAYVEEEYEEDDEDAESDFTRMKRQIAQDRELLNPKKAEDKSEAKKAVESILAMINQNDKKKETKAKVSPNKDDALASRLEQAAEEQEKRDAEVRLAAEKKREEERRQMEEEQRKREEDFRKKEEARMEAARQKAEEVRRKEEEKIEAERAGVLARQKAQDDYWAKMLQKEKKKKKITAVEQMRLNEAAARDEEEKAEREVASNVEMERIREEERMREDPHEGEILKQAADARTRDRELVRDIEVQAAARISRTVPQPSDEDVSASSFIAEQRRKKEEIDRMRKFDAEQLKSMNSPLPSPGRMKRQPMVRPKVGQVSPTMYRAPPMEPAIRAPRSPSPAPAPGLDLASLTMAKSKQGSGAAPPPPAPPSSSSPPRLDLASLTMAKPRDQGSVAPPPSPPSSTSPPRLDLASLTMAKKSQNTGAVKRPPAKRVVRQRVPIADDYDDDDEDDDNLMSAAPGMSIAEAMKQQRGGSSGNKSSGGGGKNLNADARAKQWGIDMSKFT